MKKIFKLGCVVMSAAIAASMALGLTACDPNGGGGDRKSVV